MNINVKNLKDQQVVIDIEGVIGVEECYQFDEQQDDNRISTYEKFRSILEQVKGSDARGLRVNIRSAGGSVQDALLIHSALEEMRSKIVIETHCYGFSASAATIIAQAATAGKRYVSSSALYMIHNSSTIFDGNAKEAESVVGMLTKTDSQIAVIYSERSGLPVEHFTEIMNRDGGRGEWLTAEEAVEYGLADVVESYSSVRNLVNSVKEFFGRFIVPQEARSESFGGELENVETPPSVLAIAPTATEPKEDPVVEHFAVSLSANGGSYSSDAQLFRTR